MSKDITRPVKNVKKRRDEKRNRARNKSRFDKIYKTLNGTYLYKNIECNSLPLPHYLLKAMESVWAEKLVNEGSLRLGSIFYYQQLDSEELGDPLEGKGEFIVDGHKYNVGSINKHYMFCTALPKTKHYTILGLDKKYDTIVKIKDVQALIKRMVNTLVDNGFSISFPHVGRVNYNRSAKTNFRKLNQELLLWNCFQKRSKYRRQNEYRIVVTDCSLKIEDDESLYLNMGPCTDIMEVIKT